MTLLGIASLRVRMCRAIPKAKGKAVTPVKMLGLPSAKMLCLNDSDAPEFLLYWRCAPPLDFEFLTAMTRYSRLLEEAKLTPTFSEHESETPKCVWDDSS